jgi:hypothetical protein
MGGRKRQDKDHHISINTQRKCKAISRVNDVNKVIASVIATAHLSFSSGHLRSDYKSQICYI